MKIQYQLQSTKPCVSKNEALQSMMLMSVERKSMEWKRQKNILELHAQHLRFRWNGRGWGWKQSKATERQMYRRAPARSSSGVHNHFTFNVVITKTTRTQFTPHIVHKWTTIPNANDNIEPILGVDVFDVRYHSIFLFLFLFSHRSCRNN